MSRNPKDRDICKNLQIPSGPVKRIINQMFRKPMEFDEDISGFEAFMSQLGSEEPEATKDNNGATSQPTNDNSTDDQRLDEQHFPKEARENEEAIGGELRSEK